MADSDAYPLLTSTDRAGDLPTQGFIADALAGQLGTGNADDTATYAGTGLTSPGVDTFYGIDHVHPEHLPQVPDVLDEALKGEATTGRRQVERILDRVATYGDAPFIRTKTPDVAGTGGVFVPAPVVGGAPSAPLLVLSADPQRYRVTLHQWPGNYNAANPDWQLWVGSSQGDAGQASGFPIPATGPLSFYWADDLWVGITLPNTASLNGGGVAPTAPTTAGTWLYFTVERYK